MEGLGTEIPMPWICSIIKLPEIGILLFQGSVDDTPFWSLSDFIEWE